MREYRYHTVQKLAACTCDCCKRRLTPDDGEWQERLSFDLIGGFDSVFGDGNTVSLDLCPHCVRELLGQWLRITPAVEADVFGLWKGKKIESAWDAPHSTKENPSAEIAQAVMSTPSVGEDANFARHPRNVLRESVKRYDDPTKPVDVVWKAEREKAVRRLGRLRGRVRVRHDFDAPLSLSLVSKKKPKK